MRKRASSRAARSAVCSTPPPVEVTPDKQGRIQLPAKLREYAGLDHDVTIIGSRSFAEIWNTEAWNANQETSDEDFTAAMEDLDF